MTTVSGRYQTSQPSARRHWLPHIISPHGMLERWALANHAGRKRLAWWAYQRRMLESSAGLLARSDDERSAIRRQFPRLPVAVIANGIEARPSGVPWANAGMR